MATAVPKARCRSAKGYATELATIRRNRIRRVTSKLLHVHQMNQPGPLDHGTVSPASLTDDVVLVAIPGSCHVAPMRRRSSSVCLSSPCGNAGPGNPGVYRLNPPHSVALWPSGVGVQLFGGFETGWHWRAPLRPSCRLVPVRSADRTLGRTADWPVNRYI